MVLKRVPSTKKEIYITISPDVQVTKSVPTMTMLSLISNIGGILGLTLGLGFLQIAEHLDKLLVAWVSFCRKTKTAGNKEEDNIYLEMEPKN